MKRKNKLEKLMKDKFKPVLSLFLEKKLKKLQKE